MERKYCVYKHTTPNGKVYIGLTGQEPESRWRGGGGYYKQIFGRVINKYGWDNIKNEILHDDLTHEEACILEVEEIAKHKSTNSRYGYNLTSGGELSVPTQEIIDKIIGTNVENGNYIGFDVVNEIRERYQKTSITKNQLAKKYDSSLTNIHDIINNKVWVDDNYINERDGKELEAINKEIESIRNDHNKDILMTTKELSKKYGKCETAILNITSNLVYCDDNYVDVRKELVYEQEFEVAKEIRRIYEKSDYSIKEIAIKYRRASLTIRKILYNELYYDSEYVYKAKKKTRKNKSTVSREKLAKEIRELYSKDKYTCEEISLKLGLSGVMVYKIVNNQTYYDESYTPRNQEVEILEINKEIRDLYSTGYYTYTDIGLVYGLDRKKISQIINRNQKPKNKKQELSERNNKIRENYSSGNYTHKELSVMFALSTTSISRIVNTATVEMQAQALQQLQL